jgi:hypothetical protein
VDAEKTVCLTELLITAKEAGANASQEENIRANEAKAAAANFMVVEDMMLLFSLLLVTCLLGWWVVAGSSSKIDG